MNWIIASLNTSDENTGLALVTVKHIAHKIHPRMSYLAIRLDNFIIKSSTIQKETNFEKRSYTHYAAQPYKFRIAQFIRSAMLQELAYSLN